MNNSSNMTADFPEMLTIDQTAKRSGLSAYAVRKLARSSKGQAFTVRVGTKYLINWGRFTAFFNCAAVGENPSVSATHCQLSTRHALRVPYRGANAEEQNTAGIQPVPVRL